MECVHTYPTACSQWQVLLVVNHLIFLKGLAFRSSQSGPQQRALRQTVTGPYTESRARGGLSFLSEDTHNLILDAQGANASGAEDLEAQ